MEKVKKKLKVAVLLPLAIISCVLAICGKTLLVVAFLIVGDTDRAKDEMITID